MSWPAGTPLPPVRITDGDGNPIPAALTDLANAPDRKGRADRRHLTFALRFLVADVPAQGWRAYVAAYVTEPVPDSPDALAPETAGLNVVETLRHDGPLPPQGTFAETGTVMVY